MILHNTAGSKQWISELARETDFYCIYSYVHCTRNNYINKSIYRNIGSINTYAGLATYDLATVNLQQIVKQEENISK